MSFMGQGKRAESRCRYLIRNIAQTKGWNIQHPFKGGNFLEEQEITDYFDLKENYVYLGEQNKEHIKIND